LLFEPGTHWHYSDGGPNWLAEIITIAYKRDVSELLFERVFTPIGISTKDLIWRQNAYRPRLINNIPRREFGAGVSANIDAMARIGYLYLRGGKWKENQIIPKEFVEACGKTIQKWQVCLFMNQRHTTMPLTTMVCCGGTMPTAR
jgi:CubicO group peptidase (beta-lactamase class C family)